MVDFEFYEYTYHGGSIPPEAWEPYVDRAKEQLDRYLDIYTARNNDETVKKKAICAMAEALYGFDLIANGEGRPIQSASIGSVSVSYGSVATASMDISPKAQDKELYRCANRYLRFYRGCGACQ